MKLLAVILSALLVIGSVKAQTTDPMQSPNLIGNGYSSPTGTTPYTGTGGGYSGGGGGSLAGSCQCNIMGGGGGGGSIHNGTNQTNTSGARSGHGQVIITAV